MWNNGLEKSKTRECWLDIAKCFGIILVVLNHMNVKIPFVTFLGGMFYMPLFFVASGYTYRNKGESFWQYALRKAKRLLIPYVVCNVFLFAFFTWRTGEFSKQALLGIFYSRSMLMTAETTWNMALMANLNAPTWFLTCIFLCLCIYFLIDRTFEGVKKRRGVIAAAMIVGIVLKYVSPVLLPWNIENGLYFLGLLELGRWLKEKGLAWLRRNQWVYANFFLVFVTLSYINGSVNVSISQYGRSMALYFVVGALGSLLCMKVAELVEKHVSFLAKPLAFVGRHTMPILCWHLFVIEIIKTILPMIGIS